MNATFDRIYQAELDRTHSAARAYSRTVVTYGFLLAIAQPEADDAMSNPSGDPRVRGSFFRHKATLRRAGIAPIETPDSLAALATDLGVSSAASVGRLLWTLNADRRTPTQQKRSWAAFVNASGRFLSRALDILAGADPAGDYELAA